MKILICAESFYPEINGVSAVLTNLTKELIKKKINVIVATKKIKKRKQFIINKKKILIKEFNISGNFVRGIKGEKEKYLNFIINNDADIIFFYAAQQWSFDIVLPHLDKINKKICFAPCGFSRLTNPLYKNYFYLLFKKIQNLNSIIFHSKEYQDYIISKKKNIKNLSIISNGANIFLDKKNILINRDEKRIILISEIKFNKGIDRAIIALIFSKLKNIKFYIFSQTKPSKLNIYFIYINFLNFFLKLKKIKVFFKYGYTGKKLDIERKKSNIFLFGSRLECSPLVLFESAALGLPFISFNSGNADEISKKTGAGFVVKNIFMMSKKLNMLFYNEKLNKKLSLNGLKNAKKFTWSRIASKYIKNFKSL